MAPTSHGLERVTPSWSSAVHKELGTTPTRLPDDRGGTCSLPGAVPDEVLVKPDA